MTAASDRRCSVCARLAAADARYCAGCGTALPSGGGGATVTRIDFERFFELAVDVFVVTGPNGRFELVNESLARLLGVDREVILSNEWSAFVHPDDRERSAAEAAREFSQGHRTITFENRYVDASGAAHWMDWSAELDPATGLVYGIARDVTEQRAAQADLREARAIAEAAQLAAESANRAKSEFLSRMSHELRTPLNAVLGFAQLLEPGTVNDLQRECVEQIMRGGRHLQELIDEVLDISRIEIGAVTISTEPVDVAELVAEVVSMLGPLAAARGVALRSSLPANGGTAEHVMADRQRLKQVLVNYVSNAIKYAPPGSTALLATRPASPGRIRIAVTDDGPGIGPESVERLFSPFERIGAERTEVEGTGLGLAHSKALAERMGGRVGVTSTVGAGSSFWVDLPAAEPLLAGVPSTTASPPDAHGRDTGGSLLYIEDNPSNLRLVQQALASRTNVRLHTAMLGRDGIALARAQLPDLILLDLHLPDITGATVLAELRADTATAAIPVVVLSADATQPNIDALLAAGASAYLTKPLDLRRFLDTVDEHLAG